MWNLLTENLTKIGEKLFTKKSENFSESLKISIKSHQNWQKFKGITKIGDNFVENQCGLKGMRPHSFSSEFLPKFSPILVNVLVIWIFYWIFTNFGEHFGDLKKLVSFWVTKMSPILMTIIPSDFVFLSPILVKILWKRILFWKFNQREWR